MASARLTSWLITSPCIVAPAPKSSDCNHCSSCLPPPVLPPLPAHSCPHAPTRLVFPRHLLGHFIVKQQHTELSSANGHCMQLQGVCRQSWHWAAGCDERRQPNPVARAPAGVDFPLGPLTSLLQSSAVCGAAAPAGARGDGVPGAQRRTDAAANGLLDSACRVRSKPTRRRCCHQRTACSGGTGESLLLGGGHSGTSLACLCCCLPTMVDVARPESQAPSLALQQPHRPVQPDLPRAAASRSSAEAPEKRQGPKPSPVSDVDAEQLLRTLGLGGTAEPAALLRNLGKLPGKRQQGMLDNAAAVTAHLLSPAVGLAAQQAGQLLERCPALFSWPPEQRAAVLFGQQMAAGLTAAAAAKCFAVYPTAADRTTLAPGLAEVAAILARGQGRDSSLGGPVPIAGSAAHSSGAADHSPQRCAAGVQRSRLPAAACSRSAAGRHHSCRSGSDCLGAASNVQTESR